ncbi:hypothetical protein LWI28_005308 [Acer negundo]|uniref:Uncharacterized protein n=1 Tax=Acer negundo TaxID=4023 RepID=A0AAD5NX37_ACENE|nr:hypothetical protein LWI28_005308 [Acer negundo]
MLIAHALYLMNLTCGNGNRNLVDAANIAALAALLTFQRPECSLGGEDGQEVILHPPEEREPLPLIEHHLPIAVTFGFFSSESIMVIDPTHHEEAVMAGKMTATLNANGDVEAYKTERALIKIKFHPASITLEGIGPGGNLKGKQNKLKGVSVLSRNLMERSKLAFEGSCASQNDGEGETKLSELGGNKRDDSVGERKPTELKLEESPEDNNSASMEIDAAEAGLQKDGPKTLKDAVKPKHKRKKLDELQPLEFIKISLCIEDGSSEVQLGQTHVMGFVTCQLLQPYRDRPNEGSLSIFIEFSPMADPPFELGRPGESTVELRRIIDRGLR